MATSTGAMSARTKPSLQGRRHSGDGRGQRGRWPYAGQDQLPLLLSSLAITVGSFLPWVVIGSGLQVSGFRGAGVWTFYAASVGIAGALVRRRGLAAASAAIAGGVAVAMAAWQVLHLVGQVGLDGWRPGLGLLVVAIGGVIALRSAWRLGPATGAAEARRATSAPPGAGSG